MFQFLTGLYENAFGKMAEKRLINKATQIITVNESLAEFFKMTYGVSGNGRDELPPNTAHAKRKPYCSRSLQHFSDNDKILNLSGTLNK